MLQVSTVFQISIYAMMVLSSIMLAMAEGVAFPQGLTTPLAVLAFFFTERWRKFSIRPAVAFVLGLLAFLAAASELATENLEARLLSGTHLLVYLSWIVLFQEKETRMYWWMCALSTLQVAIGSVLTNDGSYGVLLIVYLLLSFWTLSVFSLHQVQRRLIGGTVGAEHPALALAGQSASSAATPAANAPRPSPVRMGAMLRRPSTARHTIRNEPNEHWINLRFAGGILVSAGISLLIGGCFFLLVPRVWIGNLRLSPDLQAVERPRLTGYSEKVQLGEIGDILESTEPVMEVELFDADTDEKLDLEQFAAQLGYDEPLFRGRVLEHYENGSWSAPETVNALQMEREPSENMVRQRIHLEPIGSNLLFAIHPVAALRIDNIREAAYRQLSTRILLRPRNASERKPIAYDVFALDPRQFDALKRDSHPLVAISPRKQRRVPPVDGLNRLNALARDVATDGGSDPDATAMQMAVRLESYLRDSGEYTYSLEASIQDPTIDPVEDFLFNRKTGHCEYYASALTLMLRSVGIHARLANGFKGGTLNESRDVYSVQQRHAHAWVEARIGNEWLVFDATPAARKQSVESMGPSFPTMADVVDYIRGLWGAAINMNLEQQRQLVYDPLRESAETAWTSARESRVGSWGALRNLKDFLASPRRWISWQGGVAAFLIMAGVLGLYWLIGFVSTLIAATWKQVFRGGRAHRTQIAFYERFRKLCAAHGLIREPSQTQREFGSVVCRRFNPILESTGMTSFPDHLIDSFYQVRFGGRTLDQERAREIDERLSVLEKELTSAGRNGNGRTTTA